MNKKRYIYIPPSDTLLFNYINFNWVLIATLSLVIAKTSYFNAAQYIHYLDLVQDMLSIAMSEMPQALMCAIHIKYNMYLKSYTFIIMRLYIELRKWWC